MEFEKALVEYEYAVFLLQEQLRLIYLMDSRLHPKRVGRLMHRNINLLLVVLHTLC